MAVIHRKALPTQFSVRSRKDYKSLSFQVSWFEFELDNSHIKDREATFLSDTRRQNIMKIVVISRAVWNLICRQLYHEYNLDFLLPNHNVRNRVVRNRLMLPRFSPQSMEMWNIFEIIHHMRSNSKAMINVVYPSTRYTVVLQIQELEHNYVHVSLT